MKILAEHEEFLAKDPQSENTKTSKKHLLITSAIGIAIVKVNLLPTKLSVIGVDFTPGNQRSTLILLACLVAFFLVEFSLYLYHDSVLRTLGSARIQLNYRIELAGLQGEAKSALEADLLKWFELNGKEKLRERGFRSYILRAAFDGVLPILIATYSIFLLLRMQP